MIGPRPSHRPFDPSGVSTPSPSTDALQAVSDRTGRSSERHQGPLLDVWIMARTLQAMIHLPRRLRSSDVLKTGWQGSAWRTSPPEKESSAPYRSEVQEEPSAR